MENSWASTVLVSLDPSSTKVLIWIHRNYPAASSNILYLLILLTRLVIQLYIITVQSVWSLITQIPHTYVPYDHILNHKPCANFLPFVNFRTCEDFSSSVDQLPSVKLPANMILKFRKKYVILPQIVQINRGYRLMIFALYCYQINVNIQFNLFWGLILKLSYLL